jgi:hypothetical protein
VWWAEPSHRFLQFEIPSSSLSSTSSASRTTATSGCRLEIEKLEKSDESSSISLAQEADVVVSSRSSSSDERFDEARR